MRTISDPRVVCEGFGVGFRRDKDGVIVFPPRGTRGLITRKYDGHDEFMRRLATTDEFDDCLRHAHRYESPPPGILPPPFPLLVVQCFFLRNLLWRHQETPGDNSLAQAIARISTALGDEYSHVFETCFTSATVEISTRLLAR